MTDKLSEQEVAVMIRARQILKSKGLKADADVTQICQAAGISRKTGYQWAQKHGEGDRLRQKELEEELARLQKEHEQLKKDYEWVSYVNRGQQLAWELHDVDELIAAKKNTSVREKSGKP